MFGQRGGNNQELCWLPGSCLPRFCVSFRCRWLCGLFGVCACLSASLLACVRVDASFFHRRGRRKKKKSELFGVGEAFLLPFGPVGGWWSGGPLPASNVPLGLPPTSVCLCLPPSSLFRVDCGSMLEQERPFTGTARRRQGQGGRWPTLLFVRTGWTSSRRRCGVRGGGRERLALMLCLRKCQENDNDA